MDTRDTIVDVPSLARWGMVLLLVGIAGTHPAAAAQNAHAGHTSSYVDMTNRTIKALSAEELSGLKSGQGLGFALSAELNGVAGPLHALELAESLELTADQIRSIEDVQRRMREAAIALGGEIIGLESELDRRFAHGHIDAPEIRRLTGLIGALRGNLRAVHLSAHLETHAILTDGQSEAYARLRGYAPG